MRKKIKVTICLRLIKYLFISRAFTVIFQTTTVTGQSWCSVVRGIEEPIRTGDSSATCCCSECSGNHKLLLCTEAAKHSWFLSVSFPSEVLLAHSGFNWTLAQLPVSAFIVHKMFNWSLQKRAGTDNRVRLLS